MINGKYRVFDDSVWKYIYWKEIGELYNLFNILDWDRHHFTPERYVGLKDKKGIEGCTGDIRLYHGKRYKVVDDIWRFRFERNLVEFGENEDITIGEDEIWESELIGNIHDKLELS